MTPAPLYVVQGSFGRVAHSPIRLSMAPHVHHHCHVLMNVGPNPAAIEIEGRRHPIARDNAILVNAWERHCVMVDDPGRPAMILAFYIEPDWLAGVGGDPSWRAPGRYFGQSSIGLSPTVRARRDALVEMMAAPSVGSVAEVEACIFGLIDRLVRENPPSSGAGGPGDAAADQAIHEAVRRICAAHGHVPDMGGLARELGLSRPRFFDRFRATIGAPPGLFANYIRFETALSELETPDLPLIDISLDLGFAEQSSFTRFFGKHFGVSPRTYRQSLSARREG